MTKILEKIIVEKNTGNFTYTGYVTEKSNGDIMIETTRDEKLIFRREQVVERKIIKEV